MISGHQLPTTCAQQSPGEANCSTLVCIFVSGAMLLADSTTRAYNHTPAAKQHSGSYCEAERDRNLLHRSKVPEAIHHGLSLFKLGLDKAHHCPQPVADERRRGVCLAVICNAAALRRTAHWKPSYTVGSAMNISIAVLANVHTEVSAAYWWSRAGDYGACRTMAGGSLHVAVAWSTVDECSDNGTSLVGEPDPIKPWVARYCTYHPTLGSNATLWDLL